MEHNCVTFNVGPSRDEDGTYICELSDSDHKIHPEALVRQNGFTYKPTENACSNNPCSPHLSCQNGFTDKGYRCISNTQKPQEIPSSTPTQPKSSTRPNVFPTSTPNQPKSSPPKSGYLLYWNFNLLELCYDADSVCKNIWGGRPPRAELLDGAKGLRIRDA
ncbi:hypothetical protein OS493_033618 [Desmophyllum pertusum]|uniref:Uncharacterized protein n=1 Tax=Desmophyllum pertusum TaxID=174260 RepID=A0A9W9YIY5_9CNID|nr:hypothetical protein OS493_033618 [Desmophyllum pertusum]